MTAVVFAVMTVAIALGVGLSAVWWCGLTCGDAVEASVYEGVFAATVVWDRDGRASNLRPIHVIVNDQASIVGPSWSWWRWTLDMGSGVMLVEITLWPIAFLFGLASFFMCRSAFKRRYSVNRCVRCGYCLKGLSSRRCPECGSDFDSDVEQSVLP